MKINDFLDITGNSFLYVLTATQTKEIFQIISLVLSIIISLLIVIGKVVNWYKQAKQDGKISKEEIKQLQTDIKDDINNIKDKADEIVEIVEIQEKEK